MRRLVAVAVATLILLTAAPALAQGTATGFDLAGYGHFAYADYVDLTNTVKALSYPDLSGPSGVVARDVTAHWIEDAFGFGLGFSYFALSMVDWRQTIYALSTGDFAEGNPGPLAILNKYGTTGFSAFKVGLTFAITISYEYLWLTWGRYGTWKERAVVIAAGAFMNGLQGFVVESNSRVTITGVPLITF